MRMRLLLRMSYYRVVQEKIEIRGHWEDYVLLFTICWHNQEQLQKIHLHYLGIPQYEYTSQLRVSSFKTHMPYIVPLVPFDLEIQD